MDAGGHKELIYRCGFAAGGASDWWGAQALQSFAGVSGLVLQGSGFTRNLKGP